MISAVQISPGHPLAATVAPSPDWRLALVLLVLVATGVAASYAGRLDVGRDTVVVAVRGTVQLAVVAVVITAALESIWGSLAFALLMLAVASYTSNSRIGAPRAQVVWVAAAVSAGAVPVLALILGSGVIPFNGLGLVPTAGIIIGNTMVSATLTGRRAYDEITSHLGSYEAGLAVGLESRDAAYEVIQPSAKEALTPGLDKTRTVGLVSLPGAFAGVLLGGGTPLEAGAAQILVLVGLIAAQAITSALLLRFIAAAHVIRQDLIGTYPR